MSSRLIESTMPWSVLVTGSSRGLGLNIVKQLLTHPDPPKILIAACRDPDAATELQALKKQNASLHLLQLGKYLSTGITIPHIKKNFL